MNSLIKDREVDRYRLADVGQLELSNWQFGRDPSCWPPDSVLLLSRCPRRLRAANAACCLRTYSYTFRARSRSRHRPPPVWRSSSQLAGASSAANVFNCAASCWLRTSARSRPFARNPLR